jgi:cytochrome c oxidase subunit 2
MRINRAAVALVTVLTGLNVLVSLWMARVSHLWLPVPASTAAPYVDGLFAVETGIGTFIFLACVGVMAWSILMYRAEKYDVSDGAPIEGNMRLEITWTVLPFILVIGIATYSFQVNSALDSLGSKTKYRLSDESAALAGGLGDVKPIDVISRQWSWEFVYPNGVRSTELHMPLNENTRFRLISEDVLHGFYIPAFRLKQDIIPGSIINYNITPTRVGRYRLRDSMFSGGYFATNQTDVVVESPEAYQAWLKNANSQPLHPSPNIADDLWQQRLKNGNKGWATVPPAPPPMVNFAADLNAPHEA